MFSEKTNVTANIKEKFFFHCRWVWTGSSHTKANNERKQKYTFLTTTKEFKYISEILIKISRDWRVRLQEILVTTVKYCLCGYNDNERQ